MDLQIWFEDAGLYPVPIFPTAQTREFNFSSDNEVWF